MRQTSIDVYRKIQEEGLLSKLKLLVYGIIVERGPITASEVVLITKMDSKSITPRFAQLKNEGLIEDQGKKTCSITGHDVLQWVSTNRLPVKYEKPKKHKCSICNGKGYIQEQQGKLF